MVKLLSAALMLLTAVVHSWLGEVRLITSRGKHVGWPVVSAAGIAALLGVYL